MKQYLDLLQDVLDNGVSRSDRTGTGTLSIFGRQVRYDLSEGFPAVTTKKLFFKGVVEELLWFLRGETNVESLQEKNVKIWDAWADAQGNLGPIYGKQWRSWESTYYPALPGKVGPGKCRTDGIIEVDQIQTLIDNIKEDPNSRRLIVSAWNPGEIHAMALPPCHLLFQFYVANNKLSCQLYQRSADLFLGAPFNIASYALLAHMIAQCTGLRVGEFVHTIGDAHIYENHIDQVKEQLGRAPKALSQLVLSPEITSIDDFTSDNIALHSYDYHPTIKAPIAV